MKVFKFGGASIKSAQAIRNLLPILSQENGQLVVVVSALGKTTNALEDLLYSSVNQDDSMSEKFNSLLQGHFLIANELLCENSSGLSKIQRLFDELWAELLSAPQKDINEAYDQVVAFGELLSTSLVSAWLNEQGLTNCWVDIRNVLMTDSWHRNARINWDETAAKLPEGFDINQNRIHVTQGFIGSSKEGKTTTLGREGSDYTAAALAYLFTAESMTVWKDVAGIYTADPAEMPEASLLAELSYFEAIELSFYGAKIIHPKTIKPLQNKNIPLFVKSFLNPDLPGTSIRNIPGRMSLPPIYIFKKNQTLISISPKDFSFITEDHLSKIFYVFADKGLKINVSENSALSFSVCVDTDSRTMEEVIGLLRKQYFVKFNEGLTLMTIRHYTEDAIARLTKGIRIVLEQRNRSTIRMVVKE